MEVLNHIQTLIKKAAEASSALEAQQYSQAANNAADAVNTILAELKDERDYRGAKE